MSWEDIEARRAALGAEGLDEFVAWFFRAYRPEDGHEAARFHADLVRLVQRIYVEAQGSTIRELRGWQQSVLSLGLLKAGKDGV